MDYVILKSINNNVVLAKNSKTEEQVVLISKGIGFNRKINDIVSDIGKENQVYKLWNTDQTIKDFKYNKKELELIVSETAKIAQEKLGIKKVDLEKTLLDHIIFLIDRINFGLFIENPFQNEISILYSSEYEIAKHTVELIKDRIGIDVGESEIGFITLHLNSATQKRPISTSLNEVRIYNEILNIIATSLDFSDSHHMLDIKIFIVMLDKLIKAVQNGSHLSMKCQDIISSSMDISNKISLRISQLIKNEMQLEFNKSDIAFITIDIERLRQINAKKEG